MIGKRSREREEFFNLKRDRNDTRHTVPTFKQMRPLFLGVYIKFTDRGLGRFADYIAIPKLVILHMPQLSYNTEPFS